MVIIKESYEDWNSNPILTTTEEIGASLTEVDFPTTTICHEPKYQVDNWELPELILNFFSFNCWYKKISTCEDTEVLRNDFKTLLDYVYHSISSSVETSQINNTQLNDYFFGSSKNYNIYGKDLWKWLSLNGTTFDEIDEILQTSIGKYGRTTKIVMTHSLWFRTYLGKLMPKTSNVPKCKDNCQDYYSKIVTIWLKAISLSVGHLGLGTLYRHFAPILGNTHKMGNIVLTTHPHRWLDVLVNGDFIGENGTVTVSYMDFSHSNGIGFDCNSFKENEALFHSIATKIGLAISGFNISLYDYPNFFKVEPSKEEQVIPIFTYPIYSWCKHDGAVYHGSNEQYGIKWCPQEWINTIQNSDQANENPYVKMPNDFCVKGTENITGSELGVIYKIMKFAYHFYTEEDVKFLHDKVNESKQPYNMISYENFNTFWTSRRPYFIDSSGYDNKPHKPVMTNTGLCFAWNQRRISDVFKTSNGLQSFERELIGNVTYKKPEKASIKNIEIFLDKDEMTYPNRIKSPKSFW